MNVYAEAETALGKWGGGGGGPKVITVKNEAGKGCALFLKTGGAVPPLFEKWGDCPPAPPVSLPMLWMVS